MKAIKVTMAAALMALGGLGTANAAVTGAGDFMYSSNFAGGPHELLLKELKDGGDTTSGPHSNDISTVPTFLQGTVTFLDSSGTGTQNNGWAVFEFKSEIGEIAAVNFSTTLPDMPLTGLEVAWCAGVDANGCVGKESSLFEDLDSEPLSTTINGTESKFLVASWTGATGAGTLDFFVEVSDVPVPAAGLMLLAGLGGIAAMRRRRKS